MTKELRGGKKGSKKPRSRSNKREKEGEGCKEEEEEKENKSARKKWLDQQKKVTYWRNENFQLARKCFENETFAFLIYLPKITWQTFDGQQLTNNNFHHIVRHLKKDVKHYFIISSSLIEIVSLAIRSSLKNR